MGVNLSTATCFLPFNNTVTEDLIGNTEWEVVNNREEYFCKIYKSHPTLSNKKALFLSNTKAKTAPVYIRSKSTSIWNFGTQDFTISFWFQRLNNGVEHCMFYFPGNNNFGIYFNSDRGLVIELSKTITGLGYVAIIGGGNGVNNPNPQIYGLRAKWNHYAVIRYNGLLTLYMNGLNVGQYNIGNKDLGNNNQEMRIGQWSIPGTQEYYDGIDGFMSEFIVDIGHAWYTNEFTPQTFSSYNM